MFSSSAPSSTALFSDGSDHKCKAWLSRDNYLPSCVVISLRLSNSERSSQDEKVRSRTNSKKKKEKKFGRKLKTMKRNVKKIMKMKKLNNSKKRIKLMKKV